MERESGGGGSMLSTNLLAFVDVEVPAEVWTADEHDLDLPMAVPATVQIQRARAGI